MSICQDNGCKGGHGIEMKLHPSHKWETSPRSGGRTYTACSRDNCGAGEIIDGDKPCPVPVRSAFMEWAVRQPVVKQEAK